MRWSGIGRGWGEWLLDSKSFGSMLNGGKERQRGKEEQEGAKILVCVQRVPIQRRQLSLALLKGLMHTGCRWKGVYRVLRTTAGMSSLKMRTRETSAKPSRICFAELKYAIPKSLPNWAEKQEQAAADFPGLQASHFPAMVENYRIQAEKETQGSFQASDSQTLACRRITRSVQ